MRDSIRLDLLKWLIAPLLIINLIGAGLTYGLAWVPAQIAFDQSLADAAWALIPRLRYADGAVLIDLPAQAEQVLRVDHFDAIFFVVRQGDGQVIAGDRDFPALVVPARLSDPVAHDGMMRNEPVRIIALKAQVGNATLTIGVGETLRKRIRIRSEILTMLLLLEGILSCVSIVIVWLGVTKGLFPLKKMQSDLNQRSHDDLAPLRSDRLPTELQPVVRAINSLLDRVHQGTSAQQAFLANVAHQLRTPLAGIQMQLEALQQGCASKQEARHAAGLMLLSTERMIRQANQFLSLARAEPSHFEIARLEQVQLDKLVQESIQYFVDQADKKSIDLGFDLEPTGMRGDAFLLRDLIDNIIDNAIRYSPPFSTVTVRCWRDDTGPYFSVEDSGPGIAASERELIFNRFYRLNDQIAGTGLGLAIVRDIVRAHGAEITLGAGLGGQGTSFLVRFQGRPPLRPCLG